MSTDNFDPNTSPSPMPEGTVVSEDQPALQPLTGPFKFHNQFDIATAQQLQKAVADGQDTSNFSIADRVTLLESEMREVLAKLGIGVG